WTFDGHWSKQDKGEDEGITADRYTERRTSGRQAPEDKEVAAGCGREIYSLFNVFSEEETIKRRHDFCRRVSIKLQDVQGPALQSFDQIEAGNRACNIQREQTY